MLDFSSSITDVTTATLPHLSVYHPNRKTKFPTELLNMNNINPLGQRVFNGILHDCRVKGYDETLKYGKKNKYLTVTNLNTSISENIILSLIVIQNNTTINMRIRSHITII